MVQAGDEFFQGYHFNIYCRNNFYRQDCIIYWNINSIFPSSVIRKSLQVTKVSCQADGITKQEKKVMD